MATYNNPTGLIYPLDNATDTHVNNPTLGHLSFSQTTINPIDISLTNLPSGNSRKTVAEIDPAVKKLVEIKQKEYADKATKFKVAHYSSLCLGAALGIVTPFLIPSQPTIAQITSIAVVFVISFDQIFRPKDKWSLYSKATDLLQLQLFKKAGTYEQNKDLIDAIIKTEAKILTTIPDLNEILKQVKNSPKS